jgi:hypothetical protein
MAYTEEQLLTALRNADAAGDTAAAQAAARAIKAMREAKPTEAPQTPAKPISQINTELTIPEKIATKLAPMIGQGTPFGRMVQGMAEPNIAATQMVANVIPGAGEKFNRRITDIRNETEALRGEDAGSFDPARLVGNLANPMVIKAFAAIPGGKTVLEKVLTGMGAGAAAGLLTPADKEGESYIDQKTDQAKAGAVVGGAIPAVTAAVAPAAKTVYRGLLEPIVDKATVKGRAYVEAAGNRVDDVIANLKANKEFVPGSAPTAGEAAAPAGSAEFSALQSAASKFMPSEYQARIDKQNASRLAQVRTVGQDEATLKAAEKARELAANGNYAGAFRTVIKADPELARLASNPYFRDASVAANKMAKADKIDPKTQLTEYLDLVVKGMQDKITKTGEGSLGPNEKRLVTEAKEKLVEWIGKKNPAYAQARNEFAAASRPINQMQIGQALEDKLVSPISDEVAQRPGVFSQAVRDSTSLIKKATGQPRFQALTEALEPQQLAAIQSVQDDLARGARFDVLSKKGAGSVSLADVPEKVESPTFLSRVATLTTAIIDRAQGKINKQIAAEIAAEMLNPVTVADSMQAYVRKSAQNKQLAEKAANLTNAAVVFAAQE